MFIGLDFGTTNSSIALADSQGNLSVVTFSLLGQPTTNCRSLVYFSLELREAGQPAAVFAGPAAIEQYLEEFGDGRLIQSLKTFLASASFDHTQVLRTKYTLEQLVSIIIGELRLQAEWGHGPLGCVATVGRPVSFVDQHGSEHEQRALQRMRKALSAAGFTNVTFLEEPVAAALRYVSELEDSATVLVGDFGGGTSDFSLIRVDGADLEVLGTGGVGVAGDTFDSRIVRNAIAPKLGLGGHYRVMGRRREIPRPVYSELGAWHKIAFMDRPETQRLLAELEKGAEEPSWIRLLRAIVDENLGFDLYREVSRVKVALSTADQAVFSLELGDHQLECAVSRDAFERWIREDIKQIERALDGLLGRVQIPISEIDAAVLTGGTCQVPAVRALFKDRFPADRIIDYDYHSAVSKGLALAGRRVH